VLNGQPPPLDLNHRPTRVTGLSLNNENNSFRRRRRNGGRTRFYSVNQAGCIDHSLKYEHILELLSLAMRFIHISVVL